MEEIRKTDSGMSVTFSILLGHSIGVSELSVFPKEAAKAFITDSNLNYAQQKVALDAIEASEKIYYYSRLKLPSNFQGKGFGKKLLNETLKFINENNAFLINTANAYGKKDQNELIEFYQKGGMILVHEEGGLVYSPNLKLEQIKELENTNKNNKKNKI